MKINTKTITIESTGTSDYYGGAAVQGEFSGKEYYAINDVCRLFGCDREALKSIDLDSAYNEHGTTYRMMIDHYLTPVRTVGHVIA